MSDIKDFPRRNHGVPVWWIVVSFVVSSFFILVSLSFLGFQSMGLLMLIISVIMASLLAVICSFVIKERDIVTATEFQNAIFAGAAKIVSEFCMIVRSDGTIVYVSEDYKNVLFGKGTDKRHISTLFNNGTFNKSEQNKLTGALEEGKSTVFSCLLPDLQDDGRELSFVINPIDIQYNEETSKKVRLAIKPMTHPSGYFLINSVPEQKPDTVAGNKNDTRLSEFTIGTYSLRNNGKFKDVSEVFADILGYEQGDLETLKITFSDLFYDDVDAQHITESCKDVQAIVPLRSKDNMRVYSVIDHRVVKDKNDKIIRKHGIIMPFSEESIEDTPTLGEGNTLDLINNSPIPTAILNKQGDVIRSNKPFQNIAEYKSSNNKSFSIVDIVGDDAKHDVQTLFEDVRNGNSDGSKAIDITVNNAGESTASLYICPIVSSHGEDEGIIAHLIDTTEFKNLELRFVHSQKMQAVGQLAGGIAHDFNNLLTAMMGFADLLLIRHPAGDQSFADIMQIKQNANRAANLVRQLLAFSRKQTLQPKVLNVTNVLADLSNLIGRLIGENIELNMTHGRDLGDVRVDQGQLEQVIINLAVNARDAMSNGGTLSIKTSNVTIDDKHKPSRNLVPPTEDEVIENGKYVLVEVIDTGCGMEKEQIGKIFEPFYSTKEIGAGTGLGLSTVYGIIKQTDGYVYVRSKVGKGTCFSIYLQRYEKSNEDVVTKEQEKSSKSSVVDLTGKGNVLLVEDETPVRVFSKNALISKGYTVMEAENAEAAMGIIENYGKKIDIIVTDVVMPGMSGPDMIKEIMKDHPKIKVVFMSGYGEDAFVETFGEDRKFHFLSKPYTLKQLAEKVKEVIESKTA